MANRVKGEVGFTADGQDYTLLLDFNALCELENDVPGLMDGTAEIKSPSAVRAVFHAALTGHHPALNVKDAGRIIHAVGIGRAGELIREAMTASFGQEEKDGARPRKGA
ncbi:hypothetical protein [Brevundimonas sp.]|uniref:hypothetical protein n=1 Tax=Brevundimonas sp. TaxID=1871086 RepID=UPI0028A9E63D|nr:hypothetical protein [Brevundimonas sp.]